MSKSARSSGRQQCGADRPFMRGMGCDRPAGHDGDHQHSSSAPWPQSMAERVEAAVLDGFAEGAADDFDCVHNLAPIIRNVLTITAP